MKKALFAFAFLCEISLGMDLRSNYRSITDQHEKYSDLYDKWRVEFSGNSEKMSTPESKALERERDAAKPPEFNPAILDAVIQQDIGSDDVALQMLQRFFDCNFHKLIDSYPEAFAKMLPVNTERFKEILLLLAPILNVQSKRSEKIGFFTSSEKDKEYIGKVVSIWGDNSSAITFKTIQHPQFCFETFMMQVLKLDDSGEGVLFQAIRCMAEEFFASRYDWDGKAGELALYGSSIGCYEDCGGRCDPKDVWPNWCKK